MSITPEALFKDLLLEKHGDMELLPDAHVVADSRLLEKGVIFVAVAGTKFDSHLFIPDAVAAGAAAVIHTMELDSYPENVLFCRVSDSRTALSLLWRWRNGDPDETLDVYGITGTNGKTTSAFLLRHLLNHAQIPCGLISTVEFNDGKTAFPPTHTTPDPQTLFPLLRMMKENGLQAAAMELSSHSLAQNRVAGLKLKGAVFTNLTGDHLDFHGDMENYYQAKKLLFTDYIKTGGIAAINIDTPDGVRLSRELANERPDLKIPTFGKSENSGWRISESSSDINGCSFVLSNALQAFQVNFPLAGDYNISNLAGVLTLLLCDGVTPAAIDAGLSTPFAVPGRLEKLSAPNGATFFVDYAHTDDALSNVLSTLKKVAPKRVIALFGAGGDRDKSKRPRMGKAASSIADMLIITSDNPRSEEPLEIMAEIASGIPENRPFEAIVDRRNALRRAVEIADAGDIVLIAGKGHENYQEIKGVKHHFDDREELRQLFQELL